MLLKQINIRLYVAVLLFAFVNEFRLKYIKAFLKSYKYLEMTQKQQRQTLND